MIRGIHLILIINNQNLQFQIFIKVRLIINFDLLTNIIV